MSLARALDADHFSERAVAAYGEVHRKHGYAREAQHSHLVARALEEYGHGLVPVLEVDYPCGFYHQLPKQGRQRRIRADVWCAKSVVGPDRPTFIETKLGGIRPGSKQIGTKPAEVILGWYATDVYRLLACTGRAHCGMVICTLGTQSYDVLARPLGTKLELRRTVDADQVWEELRRSAGSTGAESLEMFLRSCHAELGALVTPLSRAKVHDLRVRPIVVEWLQDSAASSEYV